MTDSRSAPTGNDRKQEQEQRPSTPSPVVRFLRVALPIAISAAAIVYLLGRIDARAVADAITFEIALRLVLPFLVFNLVTVVIEARCLVRVTGDAGASLRFTTAARIKAACYLLNVLNYAVGAAGLSVLLRRRTGLGLADAAGMVFLISLFDIGAVLALAATGAIFMQTDALGVRIGLILSVLGAIAAGFVFLRIPTRFSLLERLRNANLFRAPRTAPPALLIELGFLRVLFVLCYVFLVEALMWAFSFEVSPLRLALNVSIMLVVSALPIAAGGLGTGQLVFVELFKGVASDAELLAASLVFSFALITTRALFGLLFALEFTREAIDASKEENPRDGD